MTEVLDSDLREVGEDVPGDRRGVWRVEVRFDLQLGSAQEAGEQATVVARAAGGQVSAVFDEDFNEV